jgi:hypothetical protein
MAVAEAAAIRVLTLVRSVTEQVAQAVAAATHGSATLVIRHLAKMGQLTLVAVDKAEAGQTVDLVVMADQVLLSFAMLVHQ